MIEAVRRFRVTVFSSMAIVELSTLRDVRKIRITLMVAASSRLAAGPAIAISKIGSGGVGLSWLRIISPNGKRIFWGYGILKIRDTVLWPASWARIEIKKAAKPKHHPNQNPLLVCGSD